MQEPYLGLDLSKEQLESGKYLLAAFKTIPAEGIKLLDIATEVAAESSTGSNMRVTTATNFSDDLNARVYKIDEAENMIFLAYPIEIFDRGGNIQNILTFITGNIFGMSTLSGIKLLDVWFPEQMLEKYDGPSYTINDLKSYLGIENRPVLGTIVKPKIGLKAAEFAEVAYEFWVGGGDFVKFDEPQADQSFCPFEEVIALLDKKMRLVEKETGKKKVLSVNVSAADFDTMIQRAEYVKSVMEPGSYAYLIDGITAGWMAIQTIRRKYPDVFLHFHRAGHGAFTRPENVFGFSVPVLTKFARLAGASGMHTGTAGIGKMKGDTHEDVTAVKATHKTISEGFYFTQNWGSIKKCCPIASGGLNPTKLPSLIDAFETTDFIVTMGAGCHSHPDGSRKGATALTQACQAWQEHRSLKDYAQTHPELERALVRFKI